VCATCAEHFTRRYSATRHNLTIHDNRGEIVPLLEYIVGRSSGRYRASHPSWYRRTRSKEKRIHRFGHAISADSMGDFQHRVLQQQTPFQSASQPDPPSPNFSPYPNERISQPIDTRNDQGTLSQDIIIKIQELKRLLYKYPIFSNPDGIIKCIIHFSTNGDNTILDEKLEQLRTLDAISK
ncbi:MAG: hypothetical protein WB988_06665, partial [Candidatus Nitrosopolaris sp.]